MANRKRKSSHQERPFMPKKTVCVPTHLPFDQANAIKCLAHDAGISASAYIRRLINADLSQKRAEAYATLAALGESSEHFERGERRTHQQKTPNA